IGDNASAEGAKLRLPKARSPSRLGAWGSDVSSRAGSGAEPHAEADAILNILCKNGVHFMPKWSSFGGSCYSLIYLAMIRFIAFTQPGDDMSEVVSRRLPRKQLWVSNLSKVATWRIERESNLGPSSRQASTYQCITNPHCFSNQIEKL